MKLPIVNQNFLGYKWNRFLRRYFWSLEPSYWLVGWRYFRYTFYWLFISQQPIEKFENKKNTSVNTRFIHTRENLDSHRYWVRIRGVNYKSCKLVNHKIKIFIPLHNRSIENYPIKLIISTSSPVQISNG